MAENMDSQMENDELNEILEEFFMEAEENLDQLEQDLIRLETSAGDGDRETVNRIFRVLHTLKGGAGFLGLEKIAKLAHAGENLLDEVRNDKVAVTKAVMDALLQTTDALKHLMSLSKSRQDDSGVDNSVLIGTLEALATGKSMPAAAAVQAAPAKKPAKATAPMVNADLLAEVKGDDTLDPSRDREPEAPIAAATAFVINADLLAEVQGDDTLDPSRDPELKQLAQPVVEPQQDTAAALAAGQEIDRRALERRQAPTDDRRQQGRRGGDEGGETIRVETARLDKVMNQVGELVLARNTLLRQLNQPATRAMIDELKNAPAIYSVMESLSRISQDLQMSVLSTRMQPIKKVFDKIPRQVRELKTKLAKEVNLVIEGEMTELDKTLVEELADPMVHMIRNALDHGIETPEERLALGKAPEGTLTVRAFYEGSNVVIQVQEDGKGIDPERIRSVAVKKGIITADAASALSDAAAIRLIMAPGFSTAEKVTDVSGRGVGMDVVNTNIQNMKGTLDITSEFGMGTCFSIYLPLTLAIVNALVVAASGEGFAVPIGDIAEVIKFEPEMRHKINDTDVVQLRGEPLQLFYLSSITKEGFNPARYNAKRDLKVHDDMSLDELEQAVTMALPVTEEDIRKKLQADNGYVVIVREAGETLGVVVDEMLGQEEVVIKSLTSMFEHHKAISGATISGDGKVHMILDVPYLMKNLARAA